LKIIVICSPFVNGIVYIYITAPRSQQRIKEIKCVKITYNTQFTTAQLANVVAQAARCAANISPTSTQPLLPRQSSSVAHAVQVANCLLSLSAKPLPFNNYGG
jgi:hypothetical protein